MNICLWYNIYMPYYGYTQTLHLAFGLDHLIYQMLLVFLCAYACIHALLLHSLDTKLKISTVLCAYACIHPLLLHSLDTNLYISNVYTKVSDSQSVCTWFSRELLSVLTHDSFYIYAQPFHSDVVWPCMYGQFCVHTRHLTPIVHATHMQLFLG